VTRSPPVRSLAAAVAAVSLPALALAAAVGFVPHPRVGASWWLLPVVAFGYWAAWVAWGDRGRLAR
jgi:hypothetical protein